MGENVKYDGKNNSILDNLIIKKLIKEDLLLSFCPEVAGGLPTPRIPCEIRGEKVFNKIGEDKTKEFQKGAKQTLDLVKEKGVKVAIMKSRSPSCGSGKVYDGSFGGKLVKGDGVSVKLLKQNGIKVYDETQIKEAYEEFKRIDKT